MPRAGKPAASTALPQPAKVNQNVPKNSAPRRRGISIERPLQHSLTQPTTGTLEALASWPMPGPFHQELNIPSGADLVAPPGHTLGQARGALGPGGFRQGPLCSSSRYRISGASIFQSHKTASNTASGGPSHHAKISHGGCGFHSGLGRTLRARISIPSLQDGSLGGQSATLSIRRSGISFLFDCA
jgi:hypothetical protein